MLSLLFLLASFFLRLKSLAGNSARPQPLIKPRKKAVVAGCGLFKGWRHDDAHFGVH